MLQITFHRCRTEGLRLFPGGEGRLARGRLDIAGAEPPLHLNDVLRLFDHLAAEPGAAERVDISALRKVPASGVEWEAQSASPAQFEQDYRHTVETLNMPALEQPARMWAEHHGFIWTYENASGDRAYEVRFNASHAATAGTLERAFTHTANSASEFGVTVKVCREQLDWLINQRQAAVDLIGRGHPLFFDIESIWVGPLRW